MDLIEAIECLIKELKNDKDYYLTWKANIAMAYVDCERWYKEENKKKYLNNTDKHIIANNAAKHFLNTLTQSSLHKE